MKRILTLVFYFCTLFSAYSQGGWKVLSYTKQTWAGGVAGKQGTYIDIVSEHNKMRKPDSLVALQVLGSRFALSIKGDTILPDVLYLKPVPIKKRCYSLRVNVEQRMPYLSLDDTKNKTATIPFSTYHWPKYDCLLCINPKTKSAFFIKLPKPEMLPSMSYP